MIRKTGQFSIIIGLLVLISGCGLSASPAAGPTVPPAQSLEPEESDNVLAPSPQSIQATATVTPLPTFSAEGGSSDPDAPATLAPGEATHTATPTNTPTATQAEPTVLDQINSNPDLSVLASLVVAGGLEDLLSSPDATLTLFAPIDSAFDDLPTGMLTAFENDPESTRNILAFHLVAVTADSALLRSNVGARTMLNNLEIGLTQEGDAVFVDNAQVIVFDIGASNGVIHIIDSLLLPPEAADQ